MTPTAQIEFWYEKMLSDGTKERGPSFSTQNGWWNASQLIEKHGIKSPSATTILNGKEYVLGIKQLPYDRAKGCRKIVEYYNNPTSYIGGVYPYALPVVEVHLVFKRIKK